MSIIELCFMIGLLAGSFDVHLLGLVALGVSLVFFARTVRRSRGDPSGATTSQPFGSILVVLFAALVCFRQIHDPPYRTYPRLAMVVFSIAVTVHPRSSRNEPISIISWSAGAALLILQTMSSLLGCELLRSHGFSRLSDFKSFIAFAGPGSWPSTTALTLLLVAGFVLLDFPASYFPSTCIPLGRVLFLALAAAPLALTLTRSVYLSVGCGVILTFVYRRFRGRRPRRVLVPLVLWSAAAIALLLASDSTNPTGSVESLSQQVSWHSRITLMATSFRLGIRHPVGAGVNSAADLLNGSGARSRVGQSFSLPLDFLLDFGWLGLGFLCLSAFELCRSSMSWAKTGFVPEAWIVPAVTFSVVVYCMVNSSLLRSWSNVFLMGAWFVRISDHE